MSVGRQALAAVALDYLAALDRLDLDAVTGFFAEDASLSVPTGDLVAEGAAAIRALWESFFRSHTGMEHRVTNLVVDTAERKVATEQRFTGVLRDGGIEQRTSAYFFELGPDDRFARVTAWIDRETPRRG